MLILGLTGSIGMGKSTAAERFRHHGIPVFDSDAEVHKLYSGEAVEAIETMFSGAVVNGKVDRKRLSNLVLGHPELLKKLEDAVHPLVRKKQFEFLTTANNIGAQLVVLEIPLLFETGADEKVDYSIVVSTSYEEQHRRVMDRPGMSEEKLETIRSQQMPDENKRSRADFVVDTSGEISETQSKIDTLIESLKGKDGKAFQKWIASETAQ